MGIINSTKYLIFLNFNIIITFYSAILLAFGIVLQIDEGKGVRSLSGLSIGVFSIAIGFLDLIVASVGLWVVAKKRSSILNYYSIILLMIFALQVVLGAIALGAFDSDEVEDVMRHLFLKYDNTTMDAVNQIQRNFQCCGVTGPDWWQLYNRVYPISCCSEENQSCHQPYDRGCAEKYVAVIERNLGIIGGIAVGFAPLELATAVLAWYIRLTTKNK